MTITSQIHPHDYNTKTSQIHHCPGTRRAEDQGLALSNLAIQVLCNITCSHSHSIDSAKLDAQMDCSVKQQPRDQLCHIVEGLATL